MPSITECAIPKTGDIKFASIIYVHCPISAHIEYGYHWGWLFTKKVNQVYSWSSHADQVIGIIAIPPFGQNGFWGFLRYGKPEDRITAHPRPYPEINLFNVTTSEEHDGVLGKLDTHGPALRRQILIQR